MKTSTLATFGSVATAAGIVFASQSFDAPQPVAPAPRPVAARAKAAPQSVIENEPQADEPATVEHTGTAMARQTLVSSPVPGVLEQVVEPGEVVVKGQVIARLINKVLEAKLATARQAAGDESAIKAAQARLGQARDELSRITPLVVTDAAYGHELAKCRSAVAIAEAELAHAVEQQKLAQLRVSEIETEIDSRQIKAPHGGIVSQVWQREGEVARAGSPILELVQNDELLVRVECPASAHGRLIAGSPLYVSFPGQDEAVRVTVERQAMQLNEITGTLWITLRCPNPNGTLAAGSAVAVNFATNAETALASADWTQN